MFDIPDFSLIDEPWIEVMLTDGSVDELSLMELFRRAGSIRDILGESPTQVIPILRILLAIVHRAIDGPKDDDEWERCFVADRLPIPAIEDYLHRHRERFQLFHDTAPFFQVADLRTAKEQVFPLDRLIADVPTGGLLFTSRSGTELAALTFAEAARWLVQTQGFDVSGIKSGAVGDPRVKGGKGYPIGTGYAGSLGNLYVEGNDLAETLRLNLIVVDDSGQPVWERAPQGAAPEGSPEGRMPTGITDLYTWQSRRIRLFADGDKVTGVLVANGDKINLPDMFNREPLTAWRRSVPQEKKLKRKPVYFPMTFDPRRAVWRSAEALMPRSKVNVKGGDADSFVSPLILRQLKRHQRRFLDGNPSLRIRTIGMRYGTQSAVPDEVLDDRLSVSLDVIFDESDRLAGVVVTAVDCAIQACKWTGMFAADLARAAGAHKDAQIARRDAGREEAYEAIDREFRGWLESLNAERDRDEQQTEWQRAVQRKLRWLTDAWIAAAPLTALAGREITAESTDGKALRVNIATAQRTHRFRLKSALPLAYDHDTEGAWSHVH